MLFVDRCRLAVGIGRVVIGVQHLHFITLLQEDAAIAPILTIHAFKILWRTPLQVELHVAEILACAYSSRAAIHRHHAIFHLPLGWPTLLGFPRV